jgi:hypothetical protein
MNTPPRPIRISMPPGAPGRGRPPPVQIPEINARALAMTFTNARNAPVQMNPGGSPGPGGRTGGRRKSRKTRKGRKTRKTLKGRK